MDKSGKIAVLTYTVKHRKTYDLLCLLKANGFSEVSVYAAPLSYKKKFCPIYQHRPEMVFNIPAPAELCRNLGYKFYEGPIDAFNIDRESIVLIAGAGLLPESFIKNHKIINAHPGIIPESRGLDALKWAIIENKPVGVTTHFIGEYVDAGLVIEKRYIDVLPADTFHALAQRVYENEITMLVESLDKIDDSDFIFVSPGSTVVHKRMPREIENGLLDAFVTYKRNHCKEVYI